jgi:hypothetical protein
LKEVEKVLPEMGIDIKKSHIEILFEVSRIWWMTQGKQIILAHRSNLGLYPTAKSTFLQLICLFFKKSMPNESSSVSWRYYTSSNVACLIGLQGPMWACLVMSHWKLYFVKISQMTPVDLSW